MVTQYGKNTEIPMDPYAYILKARLNTQQNHMGVTEAAP